MLILMLTVLGEAIQNVKGFVIGADDYLTKPFEPIARVKELFRRAINDSKLIAFLYSSKCHFYMQFT